MNKFYTIKEGQNGATVELMPTKEIHLSIKNILGRMMGLGYELVTETPFVLVMKKEHEITIFPSGRIIVKNLGNNDELDCLANEIYSTIISEESLSK